MKYFYSAGVMGYGNGRFWHKKYNFPMLSSVTKTLTVCPNLGCPFAVIRNGDTVWNRVGLHNVGIWNWFFKYYFGRENIIVSIAGTDMEIDTMVNFLENNRRRIEGIELNFSCPNVKPFKNEEIKV
jgi:dihydroorotate dehydrogenase